MDVGKRPMTPPKATNSNKMESTESKEASPNAVFKWIMISTINLLIILDTCICIMKRCRSYYVNTLNVLVHEKDGETNNLTLKDRNNIIGLIHEYKV